MKHLLICIFALGVVTKHTYGQNRMSLENIFSIIQKNHPEVTMYDAQIRSLDEASKGAKSWAPPEFGAGFFMTPYNIGQTKAFTSEKGMVAFMLSASQMLPNKKEQNANALLMQSM